MTTPYRVPGADPHRARARRPARPRPARRAADHRLHPRGRRARRRRSAVPGLPPGRSGLRGDPPDEPADRLDEAGARRLPRAAARPARHRPIDAGRSVIPGDTPEAQAAYLTHFRADSIVRDAELIRAELGVDRWSVLGQSFGGFTSMTYLSIAPGGPARGVHHRRPVADRPPGRRHLRRDLPARSSSGTGATSSATRTIARGSATSSAGSTTRTSGCRRATG